MSSEKALKVVFDDEVTLEHATKDIGIARHQRLESCIFPFKVFLDRLPMWAKGLDNFLNAFNLAHS